MTRALDRPLVSVVIPVYNRERYLVEAIESVLAQDYAPVELIVVDDGSTDGTAATVGRLDAGIIYLYQQNQGIAAARNAGIARATGSFLAFLDSDDLWVPDKLTRQMAVFAAQPDSDVVYGQAEQFCSPEIGPEFRQRIRSPLGILPAPLASAMLVRRASFDRVGPFNPAFNMAVEMDWYARLTDRGLRIVMLPEVVFRRRLHHANFNLEHADEQSERLRALKAVINRRRQRADPSPTRDTAS